MLVLNLEFWSLEFVCYLGFGICYFRVILVRVMAKPKFTNKFNGLEWPPLVPGTLIRRYKRFLADVRLKDGTVVTAHCPNTGSMQGCSEPGRPVYLSFHDNPKRKLKYTWELIEMPTSLVGVNTLVPNRLVFESVKAGVVPELSGYDVVEREVKINKRTRLDLVLKSDNGQDCYGEIKNCTLVNDGVAEFPDAVTTRGLKHLTELEALVKAGFRCVMFYFIQRMDARVFKPADHIDPDYGHGLRRAVHGGVEILAYDVSIDLEGIKLNRKIPCEL
jgi:sugar fermentation stimulation protein A